MSNTPFDWKIRARAALVLMVMEYFSILALNITSRNDDYYLVCGSFNLAIIVLLPAASNVNLIADLQRLNLIALCFQAFGFLSYWFEIPINIYNTAIHALNLIQILRLLISRKGDADGLAENHRWLPDFLHFNLRRHRQSAAKEHQ